MKPGDLIYFRTVWHVFDTTIDNVGNSQVLDDVNPGELCLIIYTLNEEVCVLTPRMIAGWTDTLGAYVLK